MTFASQVLAPIGKGLNCNHEVLITDDVFDAYLKCKTKSHLTFGRAISGGYSHPASDWQQHFAKNYQADCRAHLEFADNTDCFVGTPRADDLRGAKYRLIIQPYI